MSNTPVIESIDQVWNDLHSVTVTSTPENLDNERNFKLALGNLSELFQVLREFPNVQIPENQPEYITKEER